MKKTIRKNVFETNSSSIHSLVISVDGLEPSTLKINSEINRINVTTQYFGKEYTLYNKQEDKLSYIVTYIVAELQNRYDDWEILDRLKDSYYFNTLEEIIKDYCNCDGIHVIMGEESGFDHQTDPSNAPCVVDLYDYDQIKNFIFNKYITLKTCWD